MVLGLLLTLYLARALGYIDPRLWNLLDEPLTIGAKNTILFTATIIPLGAGLGFLIGWSRASPHPLLSWPARAYVDLFRGIPQLVLVLFAFFWLPGLFGLRGDEAGLFFAVLALVVHTSAYQAEIFRAGFQSVPRAQIEAAEAIGLTKWQVMRFVVLPQTFRVTLPALGNEFAVVVKDTSFLAVLGTVAADLVYWGRNNADYAITRLGIIEWVIATWLVIGLLYFLITYVVTQTVGAIEDRYRVPGLGSVAF